MQKLSRLGHPIRAVFRWWKKLGRKRWLVIPVIIALLIVNSVVQGKLNEGKPNLAKYEIVAVSARTVKKKINREAKLYQRGLVPVKQPANGVITELTFKNGDSVVKGARIARIESTATPSEQAAAWQKFASAKSALSSAQTGKLTAQAALEAARKTVLDTAQKSDDADKIQGSFIGNALESIRSSETNAREQFTAAEAGYRQSDNAIAAAEASVNAAWWEYQATQTADVIAPVSGTIENLAGESGEYVVLDETRPFAHIIANPDWIAKMQLSEREASLIKPGSPASVQLILNTAVNVKATVERVDVVGTVKEEDTNYSLTAKLDGVPQGSVNGARANVDIMLAEKNARIAVPNGAIRYREGKRYVQSVNGSGRVQERVIEVGLSDDTYTEVTSGLTAGDKILTPRIGKASL